MVRSHAKDATMIDVRFVIAHSLWILGAAVALGAFSFHHWLAEARRVSLRQMLRAAWGWRVSIAGNLSAELRAAFGTSKYAGTRDPGSEA